MDKKAAIIICFNAWDNLSTDTTIDFLKNIFEKTNYDNYEVILYENNSKPELLRKIFDYINSISNRKIVLISPINKVWYNMNREYNDATKLTDAEIYVFANNDMKIINKDWLKNAVKWLDDSSIGMVCPHTNITYGNFFGCAECPLVKMEKEGKFYSCLFTKGCTKMFKDDAHVLWHREWPSMGIYICARETLEKVGMHDVNVDLIGQDMSTMLKFENAGFNVVVAMDSLVEHYGDTGHLTLGYISKNGSNDYNFREIHTRQNISEYLKQNPRVSALHLPTRVEWDKWYENNYMNSNPYFSREEYNKWVESHKDEWCTDTRYGFTTIAIICTLQNQIYTDLVINKIESIINSIKDANNGNSELIIYENNSEHSEKIKLFEYLNKMKKLKIDIPIKWISVSYENFNINKVYNRIARFTRNEILSIIRQDKLSIKND